LLKLKFPELLAIVEAEAAPLKTTVAPAMPAAPLIPYVGVGVDAWPNVISTILKVN
jgi:hypothetical protein